MAKWNTRGTFSLAANAFPTTGGSGSGGAIQEGNTWDISASSTTLFDPANPGNIIFAGAVIRALQDNPSLDAHWKVMNN